MKTNRNWRFLLFVMVVMMIETEKWHWIKQAMHWRKEGGGVEFMEQTFWPEPEVNKKTTRQ